MRWAISGGHAEIVGLLEGALPVRRPITVALFVIDVIIIIVLAFLFVLVLPVLGFLYMDIQQERILIAHDLKRIEKLKKELEAQKDK